jgi:hypothetical protein
MFQKLRPGILSVVTIVVSVVASLAANRAVSAARPESLLTAGTARFALASATGSVSTTTWTSWVDLPGMAVSFTIPSGKRGDVMVVFCGVSSTNSQLDVHAVVGGLVASPGAGARLVSASGPAENRCATFYKVGVVGTGSPMTVKMQWTGGTPGTQSMTSRSLVVIVNIH